MCVSTVIRRTRVPKVTGLNNMASPAVQKVVAEPDGPLEVYAYECTKSVKIT